MKTIFRDKYEIEIESCHFVEALFYQMCKFHITRPNDKIFKGFFELERRNTDKIESFRILKQKLEEKELNFKIITSPSNMNIFTELIENKAFTNEPNEIKYKKADISNIVKDLKVTLILMKESTKKTNEKIVFSYGELPIVIEKYNKRFRSIISSHIPFENDSTGKICYDNGIYWPYRWSKSHPNNFSIEKYIQRIQKHGNYSLLVRYAIEDFYCKCPWKEDICLEYLINFSTVSNHPLYYSVQNEERNEVYRCYYCKNLKQEKKTCMHCAIAKGDTQVIKQQKCSKCDDVITEKDYILIDENIFHYDCYID